MVLKFPCLTCNKSVKSNQNGILCVSCSNWAHLKCSGVSREIFNSDVNWICDLCLLNELPQITFLSNDVENSEISHSRSDVQSPKISYRDPEIIFNRMNTQHGLNIGHLNVCSLPRNLDEIKHILKNNQRNLGSTNCSATYGWHHCHDKVNT